MTSFPHLRRAALATVSLVFAMMLARGAAPAPAQSIVGIPFASPAPSPSGLLASAPVELDGRTLFSVTAGDAGAHLDATTRADDVEAVLAEIIVTVDSGASARTNYDPSTLRVVVAESGGESVVQAVDARHTAPLEIVTATLPDAQANGVAPKTLATKWQGILQTALLRALAIRQPGAQSRHLEFAAILGGVLLLVTLLGIGALRFTSRRIGALAEEVQTRNDEIDAATSGRGRLEEPGIEAHRRHVTALTLLALKPSRRLSLYRAARGAILWLLVLLWVGAAGYTATLFPQTTPLGHTVLRNAFAITAIWLVTGLLDRISAIVIGRLPLLWELRKFASPDDRTRQTLRVPTIVRAMNGFKTFVLVFLAALATMTQIDIPVGSVVTIGGVAAIAVSLAAQNLIRDVVSGFLVLSEDQFVVGDFVTINTATGLVERLTLRMVQIRDGSGSLVTIANSAATTVVNHSRNWSRVDYAVSIDPAADVDAAMALICTTVETLQKDDAWHDAILAPVEWIGVESMSRDGVVIRARIKTAPLRQFALQRELNYRVVRAFADATIALGAPVPAMS